MIVDQNTTSLYRSFSIYGGEGFIWSLTSAGTTPIPPATSTLVFQYRRKRGVGNKGLREVIH